MVAVIQSPEDICNAALARVGWRGPRIGSLYDGSMVAKTALDIYGQTRDELLRQNDFDFAERSVSLTLLKFAPDGGYGPGNEWNNTFPPPPWVYEYAYPTDALKVRALKPEPTFLVDYDPQPFVFSVANDQAFNPPAKVILCNVPKAILIYTGQVTDPADWEADFTELMAAALGRRLAPKLAGLDAAKLMAQDEAQALATAEREQG